MSIYAKTTKNHAKKKKKKKGSKNKILSQLFCVIFGELKSNNCQIMSNNKTKQKIKNKDDQKSKNKTNNDNFKSKQTTAKTKKKGTD